MAAIAPSVAVTSRRRPLAVLLFLAGLSSGPISGCSLVDTYLFPTNFELVRMSDVIVIARAAEYLSGPAGYFVPGRFRFEPVERIRGSLADEPLILGGTPSVRGGGDPTDFLSSRTGGGACSSNDYRVDHLYLLLFRRVLDPAGFDAPRLELLSFPFARVNEEVADLQAPWAEAVRRYSEISAAAGSAAEETALSELRQAANAAESPVRYPPGLVPDIDDHFLRPTDQKTAAQLVRLFESAANDPDRRRDALTALANRKDPQAADLARRLVSENRIPPGSEWNIARIAAFANDPTLTSWLFALAFRSKPGDDDRFPVFDALVDAARPEHRDQMIRLLEGANNEEAVRLARWFEDRRPAEAREQLWRRLLANPDQDSVFIESLAALGDDRVLGPAIEPSGRPWSAPWIPDLATGHSTLPAADERLDSVLAAGDVKRLVSVTQALETSRAPQRDARLRLLLQQGPRDLSLRCWLRASLRSIRSKEPTNREIARLLAEIDSAHPEASNLHLHCR